MTDKPFKEPKVGGKLDAAAPWMMAVGTLLAVAGFVLTFTLAPLVNGAAVSEPQVIAGTVVANKLLISQKIFYWHVPGGHFEFRRGDILCVLRRSIPYDQTRLL